MTHFKILFGMVPIILITFVIHFITKIPMSMTNINPDGTVVLDLTGDSRSTASTASSSSSSKGPHQIRKKWGNHRGIPSNVAVDLYKGPFTKTFPFSLSFGPLNKATATFDGMPR